MTADLLPNNVPLRKRREFSLRSNQTDFPLRPGSLKGIFGESRLRRPQISELDYGLVLLEIVDFKHPSAFSSHLPFTGQVSHFQVRVSVL